MASKPTDTDDLSPRPRASTRVLLRVHFPSSSSSSSVQPFEHGIQLPTITNVAALLKYIQLHCMPELPESECLDQNSVHIVWEPGQNRTDTRLHDGNMRTEMVKVWMHEGRDVLVVRVKDCSGGDGGEGGAGVEGGKNERDESASMEDMRLADRSSPSSDGSSSHQTVRNESQTRGRASLTSPDPSDAEFGESGGASDPNVLPPVPAILEGPNSSKLAREPDSGDRGEQQISSPTPGGSPSHAESGVSGGAPDPNAWHPVPAIREGPKSSKFTHEPDSGGRGEQQTWGGAPPSSGPSSPRSHARSDAFDSNAWPSVPAIREGPKSSKFTHEPDTGGRGEQQTWGGAPLSSEPSSPRSHARSDAFDSNAWPSVPADRGGPKPSTSMREPDSENNGTWDTENYGSRARVEGQQARSRPKRPGFWKPDGGWDSEAAARAAGPAASSYDPFDEPPRRPGKWKSDGNWDGDSAARAGRPIASAFESSVNPLNWPGKERVGSGTHSPLVSPNPPPTTYVWTDDALGDRPKDLVGGPPIKQHKSIFPRTAGEKSLNQSRWATAEDDVQFDSGRQGQGFPGQSRHNFKQNWGNENLGPPSTQPGQSWDSSPQESSQNWGSSPQESSQNWNSSTLQGSWNSNPAPHQSQSQDWDSSASQSNQWDTRDQSQSQGQGKGVGNNGSQNWDFSTRQGSRNPNPNPAPHQSQSQDRDSLAGQSNLWDTRGQSQGQGNGQGGGNNGWERTEDQGWNSGKSRGGEWGSGVGEDQSGNSGKPKGEERKNGEGDDQHWNGGEQKEGERNSGGRNGHLNSGNANRDWNNGKTKGGDWTSGGGEDQNWNSGKAKGGWNGGGGDDNSWNSGKVDGGEGINGRRQDQSFRSGEAKGGWNSGVGDDNGWNGGKADGGDQSSGRTEDQSMKSGGAKEGWNSGGGEDQGWDMGEAKPRKQGW